MNFSKKSKALAAGLSLGAWILAAAAPAGAQDASGLEERVRRLEERLREKEGAAAGEGGVAAPQGLYRDSEGFHIGATSLGAYGEFIYNNVRGGAAADKFDARRVVLFVGHEFSDEWRFFTEIEVEHGGAEVGLEQAFLDYRPREELGLQFGALLAPLGIVNLIHEPTTFYFAERPQVDRVLIPTTFTVGGVMAHGTAGDFSYQLGFVNSAHSPSAADLADVPSKGIRWIKEDVVKEGQANDFAVTGRLEWQPTLGFTLGLSGYTGEMDQDDPAVPADARVTIASADARWQWKELDVRGEYVAVHINDAAALNTYAGGTSVPEHMHGGYVEAAYNFLPALGISTKQKLFAAFRGEWLDLQDQLASNGVRDLEGRRNEYNFGLAWKPIEGVILKSDYQVRTWRAGNLANQVNAAAGFSF